MSRRINIVLPDETISVLDRVTTTGKRSEFISRAVLHYIETRGRQSLRQKLETGYSINTGRDLGIAAEWFPLEEESANKSRVSPVFNKSATTKHK